MVCGSDKYVVTDGCVFVIGDDEVANNRLFVCNLLANGTPDWENLIPADEVENWEGTFWDATTVTFAVVDAYRDKIASVLGIHLGTDAGR